MYRPKIWFRLSQQMIDTHDEMLAIIFAEGLEVKISRCLRWAP